MKSAVLIIIFSIICLVLQTSFFPYFFSLFFNMVHLNYLSDLKIDFCLIIVCYLGFKRSTLSGMLLVVILGYLSDLFSPANAGIYSFLNIIIFLLVKLASSRFYVMSSWSIALFSFVFTIIQGVFILILFFLARDEIFVNFYQGFLKTLVPQSLINMMIAPIIFKILHFIDELRTKKFDDSILTKGL